MKIIKIKNECSDWDDLDNCRDRGTYDLTVPEEYVDSDMNDSVPEEYDDSVPEISNHPQNSQY